MKHRHKEEDCCYGAIAIHSYTAISFRHEHKKNTELNELRITLCSRKSEVYVEKISVCNLNENLAGHGIHCLP